MGSINILGPYEAVFNNTVANLNSLAAGWFADPFPFLHQVIANQMGYCGIVPGLVNFAPQQLAEVIGAPASSPPPLLSLPILTL